MVTISAQIVQDQKTKNEEQQGVKVTPSKGHGSLSTNLDYLDLEKYSGLTREEILKIFTQENSAEAHALRDARIETTIISNSEEA